MKITSITFEVKKNLGNYNSIGATATVEAEPDSGDTVEEMIKEVKTVVAKVLDKKAQEFFRGE